MFKKVISTNYNNDFLYQCSYFTIYYTYQSRPLSVSIKLFRSVNVFSFLDSKGSTLKAFSAYGCFKYTKIALNL